MIIRWKCIKMKFNDKLNYIKYKTRFVTIFIVLLILFLIFLFYFCLDRNDLFCEANIAIFVFCFIALGALLYYSRNVLVVLFSAKLKLVDGHIFKKNMHRNHSGDSYTMDYRARAISNNEQYSTPWFSYRKGYGKYENVPVKIIVKNNKGIDFYIDDYSFKKEK